MVKKRKKGIYSGKVVKIKDNKAGILCHTGELGQTSFGNLPYKAKRW
ncbi:MAG TPA: hypothetical protein GX711_10295 [Clostridia bacterium]|nr:hypothetical protein [Clostridia bacterium]